MVPIGLTMTVEDRKVDLQTAYAGWQQCWKHWGGQFVANGHIHAAFMEIPFARSVQKAGYQAKLRNLIRPVPARNSVLTETPLSLSYSSNNLSDELFAFNDD